MATEESSNPPTATSWMARSMAIRAAGPLRRDRLSYYPYWHGTLDAFRANLNDVATRYGKPLIVAETAYPFTTADKDGWENIITSAEPHPGHPAPPEGQTALIRKVSDLVRNVPGGLGLGVFYARSA
ncbi:glycosyl hydrolase 53 family protein [Nonomuraea sp. NPDC048916]|uniref:glycosyl hydrolase 53 family protein n=1 Tax=Nonomuraea sp. NPDC048916 TaxID=3154232 RepID=UPI00340F76AF